ncbi:MAG: ABC-type Fe3+ transport system periplasmic component [Chloroflexi bacterium]|nr:ABC-type Fe3+ transport system periplasmic component [Chloroflexota bacterium]
MPIRGNPGLTRRAFIERGAALGGTALLAGCQPPTASAPTAPAPARGDPQSDEWNRTLEAARREGSVNLYGGMGPDNRAALVAPFERAYPGIKVNGTFGAGRDLVVRISSERTAGKNIADVLIGPGASGIIPLKPIGALLPIVPTLMLPEVTDTSNWLDNHFWFLDAEEPYTTLGYVGIVQASITVNHDVVDPKQFTSMWDLTDPKWKGKMCASDVRAAGAGSVQTRYWYTHPQLGPPFMEKLFGEMDITLSTDGRQLIDWIALGRFPIGVLINSVDIIPAQEQGLPLTLLPGDQAKEGAPIGVSGGTANLVEGRQNPNAAKIYMNWLLSRDGQMSWQREVKQNSLRVDIPKDGIPAYTLPKPGVKYVNTATESYGVLSGTVITDLLNRVLPS